MSGEEFGGILITVVLLLPVLILDIVLLTGHSADLTFCA